MTDTKISGFANGGALQGTDEFVVARAGVNKKILGSAVGGSQGVPALLGPYPIETADVPALVPLDIVTLPVGTVICDWYTDPDTAEDWGTQATIGLGQGAAFVPGYFFITAVNQGSKKFSVAGDRTADFGNGAAIYVTGSTGNDGAYTVASAAFAAGATGVVVVEAIPDATADGVLVSATPNFVGDVLGYLDAATGGTVASSALYETMSSERIIADSSNAASPIKVVTVASPVQVANTSVDDYATGRADLYLLVATPTLTVPS